MYTKFAPMNSTTRLTIALAALSVASAKAQIKVDSVSIGGAGNPSQTYYDFRTGIKGTAAIMNWDIAETSDPRDAAVKANHMAGLRVYKYRKSDQTGWSTFDTTGWKSWSKDYNDLHSHSLGAINANANFPSFKYGWGTYDASASHNVVGDSLFLLVWVDQTETPVKFLKFCPIKIIGTTVDFVFKYANVDGTSEVTDTLFQSKVASQNYKYYKFSTQSEVVREPASGTWDITFTRYYDFIQGIYYPVVGVESNRGTRVAKITTKTFTDLLKDTSTLKTTYKDSFFNDLTAIGSDWKAFNFSTNVYDMADKKSYLVRSIRSTDTGYYLIHFTKYEGGSAGKSVFNYLRLPAGLNATHNAVFGTVNVFPNPATNVMYVTAENTVFGNARLSVKSLNGQEVWSMNINQNNAFGAYEINTNDFAKGMYLVSIENAKGKVTQKVIVH